MIQLVRRRINSSVAFNKCGSSFPAAQAANRKEAQQESNEWEHSECVFARFKPASRKTLAARSLSFSLSASEDSACSPPTVILALSKPGPFSLQIVFDQIFCATNRAFSCVN